MSGMKQECSAVFWCDADQNPANMRNANKADCSETFNE